MELTGTVIKVAELMAISAKTAPKAVGADYIEIALIKGEDVRRLADAMREYGVKTGKKNYDRDAKSVDASDAVLVLGLKRSKGVGNNCGACGFATCAEMDASLKEFGDSAGPNCVWRLLDLGIALGSAVKTASNFNVDNRIMTKIGIVARRIGFIECEVAAGIPLSAKGKSPYFDR